MKPLTAEDIALNNSGTLTNDQLSQIRKKGIINTIAALCFLAFIPIGLFATNIRSTTVLVIWMGSAILFGGIFLWLAVQYLFLKKEGHTIQQITGKIEKKPSGNKNTNLRIGERNFFLRNTEVKTMEHGEEYTVYFIDNPKMPLGYVAKQDLASN
jgi:hypothetical protein